MSGKIGCIRRYYLKQKRRELLIVELLIVDAINHHRSNDGESALQLDVIAEMLWSSSAKVSKGFSNFVFRYYYDALVVSSLRLFAFGSKNNDKDGAVLIQK